MMANFRNNDRIVQLTFQPYFLCPFYQELRFATTIRLRDLHCLDIHPHSRQIVYGTK